MRCESCTAREATEEVRVTRARGIVDVYRLCRWCHGEAIGKPVPVVCAPSSPCPACHKRRIVRHGLCTQCLEGLYSAMRAAKERGWLPRPGSKAHTAALHVDPDVASGWVRADVWRAIVAQDRDAAK